MTIAGANFVSGATVSFGATAATSVMFVNSTTLVAITPAGSAGAVAVAVTNPGGATGSLGGGFTYAAGSGVQVAPPAVPNVSYSVQADVGEPDTSGYAQLTVPALADSKVNGVALEAAITVAAATCNTVILLTPGGVYDGGTTGITLPPTTCAAGKWIVIRSAASDSNLPAAGKRMDPSFAAQLPTIVVGQLNVAAIAALPRANDYLLEFLQVSVNATAQATAGWDSSAALIDIGDGTPSSESGVQLLPSDQPTNIVVDRDLIRGGASVGIRRGVGMECARCAVLNSYIDRIQEVGFDSQAIAGW
ncbi:MAG: IPT/TIG domain-containing protein, partial [Terriglobales bacterium]